MLLIHDRIRHQTALHYAIIGGNIDCVRLLLGAAAHTAPAAPGTAQRGPTERQLLLSSANHAGLTALHYAVHEERYDAMKLLLSSGADINAQVGPGAAQRGAAGVALGAPHAFAAPG
jgi:ankyrin repeat protein